MNERINAMNWNQFKNIELPKICEKNNIEYADCEDVVILRVSKDIENESFYNSMEFYENGDICFQIPFHYDSQILIKEGASFECMLEIIKLLFVKD